MSETFRPARLIMTADTYGGVWDYSVELAANLSLNGVQVVLAVMGRPPSAVQRVAASAVPGLVMHHAPFALEWFPDAESDLAAAGKWLLTLEAEYAPDLIHLNGFAHAVLPWQAPCLVVAHSCVLSWWRAVRNENAPGEWHRYGRRVAAGLRRASRVVMPTAALRRTMEELYGQLPHATIIWNGRDPSRYHPGKKKAFILSAGRIWDEAKNIAAMEKVAGELDWPIMVAGDWQRPEGGGSPPEKLQCLGMLPPDEFAAHLGRAAIYALPARYEPFGLTILEAALSGCALVLGNIPTLRELWNGAALFVQPSDHGALTDTLAALTGDAALTARLGLAARRRALTYSAQRMTAAYLALYGGMLATTAPPHPDPPVQRVPGVGSVPNLWK